MTKKIKGDLHNECCEKTGMGTRIRYLRNGT